jgi:hypothetical protein
MYKAASKKIGIFLTGFILLAWAAFGPASPCSAGMQNLSDGEMAAVYAYGFSTFSLTGDLARVDFNNVTLSTWTEISSMKMGYYDRSGMGWDNDWTNVSLGTSGSDLVAQGLFIEAKFTNMADPATRTLDYVRIGTTSLTGPVRANFNSFSGTLDNGVTNTIRTSLGTSTITAAAGTGFYLELNRSSGYSFHWVSATKAP